MNTSATLRAKGWWLAPIKGARWRIGLLLLGASLCGGPLTAAGEPPISKEYHVKAAFLYNFTKFVEWPPQRFADDSSPIVVGVLGRNPFGDELEKIVANRMVNGRNLIIVHLQTADEALSVHAVFIAAGEEGLIERQIGPLLSAGVLTVGESRRFLALGGTVMFTTDDNKVRFEINMAAAQRGGLKVSAQLQKLATVVRRQP